MRKIQISDHFKCSTLLLFALPSIGMQLVDNTYQVADGYFISNYIGKDAFAAENLIFPPLAVVAGVGLMFGSGAAALISHTLGEGDREKANRQLSLTIGTLAAAGILLGGLLLLLLPAIARLVGVPEDLIPYCVQYGRILAVCIPFLILNGAFHPLLITAGRPGLGFLVTVLNAAVNILLDWVAVAKLGWGLKGAALATGLAWVISATIPIVWFSRKQHDLHYGRFHWVGKEIGQICYNGSSEMAGAISYALVAMLFNKQLLRYAGENGVSAYAVSVYVTGVFASVFVGIGMSTNPAVGYHRGNGNMDEVRSIRRNGLLLTAMLGLGMGAVSFILAPQIAGIFVSYDAELMALSTDALRIISFAYLLSGMTIFSSAFFTGMGDGTASLCTAGMRTLVIPLIGLLVLPGWLHLTGIWLVTPLAEVFSLATALFFYAKYRKKGIL